MTAEGIVGEGYGKVYLNYDFVSNSADKNQGDFSGGARTINNDGVMVAGTLQVFGSATVRSSPCIP